MQPHEVGLGVGGVHRQVVQLAQDPPTLLGHQLAPALDLHVAHLERVRDPGLGEHVDPKGRRDRGQERRRRGRGNRVPRAEAGEPVDLREGAEDDHALEGIHEPQDRVARLGVLELHVRLVDQQVHVLGQRAGERRD